MFYSAGSYKGLYLYISKSNHFIFGLKSISIPNTDDETWKDDIDTTIENRLQHVFFKLIDFIDVIDFYNIKNNCNMKI